MIGSYQEDKQNTYIVRPHGQQTAELADEIFGNFLHWGRVFPRRQSGQQSQAVGSPGCAHGSGTYPRTPVAGIRGRGGSASLVSTYLRCRS